MGDINRGLTLDKEIKATVDFVLGNRVERGSRLVENDNGCILIKCPRKRELLRLAARDFNTVLIQILIKICIFLIRQAFCPVFNVCIFKAGIKPVAVKIGASANIVSERNGEYFEILKNNRIKIYDAVLCVVLNVNAVNQNFAVGHIVKAAHQFNKSCFAASVSADHG